MKSSIILILILVGMFVLNSLSLTAPNYNWLGSFSFSHYFDTYTVLEFGEEIQMNVFDRSNYPTVEPSELVAGDRWAWKRQDLTDYGDGYSFSYELTKVEHCYTVGQTEYYIHVMC